VLCSKRRAETAPDCCGCGSVPTSRSGISSARDRADALSGDGPEISGPGRGMSGQACNPF
jgi:hypothetical protein